jgi:hypothetical protein
MTFYSKPDRIDPFSRVSRRFMFTRKIFAKKQPAMIVCRLNSKVPETPATTGKLASLLPGLPVCRI